MTRLKQMQSLAIAEAKKLKKAATKEEIIKLDLLDFDPLYHRQCIYGQMTGDCYSNRAAELIRQCASKVYDTTTSRSIGTASLNGKPTIAGRGYGAAYNYSPIEVLITPKNGGMEAAKKIIAFLKDETKELKF